MKLHPKQQEAVTHNGSPLLVIAGAGTGKTTVITERIIYFIEQEQVAPEVILALTFTDKAANEMLERVDLRLPLGHSEATIKTFHSFCDQILKRYGSEIGINVGYRILSQVDSWMFFKEHLFDFSFEYYRPFGNPTKFIASLISYFGKLQDENVTPSEYGDYVSKLPEGNDEEKLEKKRHYELSSAYLTYLELKLTSDVMEFSDLHYYVMKLFKERPNVLSRVRESYARILVDEFQDTNLIQFDMIQMLSGDGSGLTVVADDDQSIYAFRGSNITNILKFTDVYPSCTKVSLTENYRSPQEVLDYSYTLIQHNNPERLEVKEKIDKKLHAFEKKSGGVHFEQFRKDSEEVAYVVDTIVSALESGKYSPSDMAILVRANNYADPFVEELNFRGIPYQFLGLRGLYEREEIKDLLCFLRFMRNPHDTSALFRLMKLTLFGLDMDEILLLLNKARSSRVSLWQLLQKVEHKKAKDFVTNLQRFLNESRNMRGGALLYMFVKEYYYPLLLKEETLENEKKVLNISAFFDRIKHFESGADYKDVSHLIDFLDLVIEAGENPATAESEIDTDAVKIMTVHASKGLEFPYVFVPSLVSQRFPSVNRSETIVFPDGLKKDLSALEASNISEERRLFYVACTRAREYLHLTASRYYGDAKRPKKVSQFVTELGFTLKEFDDESKEEEVGSLASLPVLPSTKDAQSLSRVHAPKRISYSQISTFQACPRQYEYNYIYKIPGESSPALSFGISLHNTLKRFYEALKAKVNPTLFDDGKKEDTHALLLSMYDQSFLRSDYMTQEHQKQAYEAGKRMLEEFYKVHGPEFKLPFLIEKSFVVPIGDFVFTGRFDRVDKLDEGSCEVIDYKTGKVKSQRDADKDLQLSLYALACKEALKMEPKKLSLYFLDGSEILESTRSDEEIAAAKQTFLEVAEQICGSDFAPTPDRFTCGYCAYRNICDSAILS